MKYYKDFQNNVYAFELDGSQDHLIKSGLTQINPNEIPNKQYQLNAQNIAKKQALIAGCQLAFILNKMVG